MAVVLGLGREILGINVIKPEYGRLSFQRIQQIRTSWHLLENFMEVLIQILLMDPVGILMCSFVVYLFTEQINGFLFIDTHSYFRLATGMWTRTLNLDRTPNWIMRTKGSWFRVSDSVNLRETLSLFCVSSDRPDWSTCVPSTWLLHRFQSDRNLLRQLIKL